jgi:hypothetical protein
MDGNPIVKVVFGAALVYVLWGLLSNVTQFTSMLKQGSGTSNAIIAAERNPIGAAELKNELVLVNAFGLVARAGADLRCESRGGQWHFTCSFAPTPRAGATRVQFGVNVDGLSTIVEVSPLIPMDARLPAPQRAVPPRMAK